MAGKIELYRITPVGESSVTPRDVRFARQHNEREDRFLRGEPVLFSYMLWREQLVLRGSPKIDLLGCFGGLIPSLSRHFSYMPAGSR